MTIFRVEKTANYTVMSNHHLRNKKISLKAKGLLSQMLSLPENWDCTLSGLAQINQESRDAIRGAINELEQAGYIVRSRKRDAQGRLRGTDYVIHELPQLQQPKDEQIPTSDPPTTETPTSKKPTLEDKAQLNKDLLNKDLLNKDLLNKDSLPFPSLNPSPESIAARPPERKGREMKMQSEVYIYRELIRDTISYDALVQDYPYDREMLDEILDLITETICTAREHIRIASDDFPSELVKAKFLKLRSEHIRFVMECIKKNTTEIRNIKQYLKAALFNAPSTIGNYHTSLVAHNMAIERTPQKQGIPEYTYKEGQSL